MHEIVVVGTSLGGLNALQVLLRDLGDGFALPVVIVQHRGTDTGDTLRVHLQRHSPLRVREPNDKEAILPGKVYLAPADYHLLIDQEGFALSVDPPVWSARPSIDVLFESAADAFGPGVVAVVLTGLGRDGAEGAAWVKSRGGHVVVEDPRTAESPALPRHTTERTGVDRILELSEIGPYLVRLCGNARNQQHAG